MQMSQWIKAAIIALTSVSLPGVTLAGSGKTLEFDFKVVVSPKSRQSWTPITSYRQRQQAERKADEIRRDYPEYRAKVVQTSR
jgi:hypothetical protein